MERSYTIYRPSMLIRDVYAGDSSYYRAKDVDWSPFTRIGSLAANVATKPTPREARVRRSNPVRTPVFPAGFALEGITGGGYQSEALYAEQSGFGWNLRLPEIGPILSGLKESVVDIASRIWRRVSTIQVLPRKYSLDRGLYIELATKLRAAAGIGIASAALLVMMVSGPLRQGPNMPSPVQSPLAVQPQAMQAITAAAVTHHHTDGSSAVHAASVSDQQLPDTTITPASPIQDVTQTVNQTTTPVSVPVAPIVGGMGSGPIVSVPPVNVDTSPITAPITGVTDPITDPITAPIDGSGSTSSDQSTATVSVPTVTAQLGGVALSTPPVNVTL